MDMFKKATVAAVAVAVVAAGTYTGLSGLSSILSDRFSAFMAQREASIQNVEEVAK